ncbi:hypothetical protein M9Y10_009217 [Tritrichomonas musculus]|uniref:Uncharacterized protein n=1 Tax=Tritrichomonas musculus TaxID=1915356 RepID=A0ABR2IPL3_9EUKA
MVDISKMIPVLPSSFLPDNANAIDWGACGIACFATGSTINFFDIVDGQIHRLYSRNFGVRTITALKFHEINRIMAFGDADGNLLFWDVEKRGIICSILPYAHNSACLDICWKGSSIIALFSNNHMVQMCCNPNINTENLRRMEIQWDIQLKNKYSRLSFDPHLTGYILLSSNMPQFSVYQLSPGETTPQPFYECVELSTPNNIQDIQWSLHFPGFIWVLLENEIVFFHIDSKTLIPMIRQRSSASSFLKIIQFKNTHKNFITFHRNGLLTVFKSQTELKYAVTQEILPKHCSSQVITLAQNPISDKELFLVYSEIGPVLYDVDKEKIVNSCFNFPVTVTAIDCSENYYAVGTTNGCIVIFKFGTFDLSTVHRYQVCNSSIEFVGISQPINKIFFKSHDSIGEIRLDSRKVIIYNSRALPPKRCISTSLGAFIVQRDTHILGIYINGKEMPALLPSDIIDIAVKDAVSGPSSGELGVLLASKEIIFIRYNETDGVKILSSKFSIKAPVSPIALCFSDKQLLLAFDSGNILIHDFEAKKTKNASATVNNVKTMRICGEAIFGLCGSGNTLFWSNGEDFKQYSYSVKSFVPLSNDLIFIVGGDNIARFLKVNGWRQIYTESTILLPDTSQQRFVHHVQNHPLLKIGSPDLTATLSDIANSIGSIDESSRRNSIEISNNDSNNNNSDVSNNDNKESQEDEHANESNQSLNNEDDPNQLMQLPKRELPEESLEGFGLETPWFHPKSRDLWYILRDDDKIPLMVQCHSGSGETGYFEKVMATLYSMVQYVTPEFLMQKFSAALFANEYDTAAQILIHDNPVESSIFKNATLAGCVIACEENPSDKLITHLKSASISLILQGSYEEGAILLRMSKLDKIAAEYFLDHDQLHIALKFIRACLTNPNEKKSMLTKIASKFYSKGNKERALLLFASAGEWHFCLWILKNLGRTSDAFFIKKYLIYRGILKPINAELQKAYPDVMDLIDLIAQIDIDFAEFASESGIDNQMMKKLLA